MCVAVLAWNEAFARQALELAPVFAPEGWPVPGREFEPRQVAHKSGQVKSRRSFGQDAQVDDS